MTPSIDPTRRRFLALAGSCAAHLVLLGAGGVPARRWADGSPGRPRAQEPWGTLHEIADGVWALVSDPFADPTPLCNGGIVAGPSGVAVVEAFASEAGAAWMAAEARRLTGRAPDLVVVTHHHGDHSAGMAGFAPGGAGPALHLTAATRQRIRESLAEGSPEAERRARALDEATLLPDGAPTSLDLGGRRIVVTPRRGHTASDVTVELDDPAVVFCGDLVWNGMFPNYVDAVPSELGRAVVSLPSEPGTRFVPGHGPLADGADLPAYRAALEAVETHARAAYAEGRSAAEAATDLVLPSPAAGWTLFAPTHYERALGAWLRELDAGGG